MTISNVAVIGCGTMGNGIAQVCAMSGKQVTLVDLDEGRLDKALASIEKSLMRVAKKGKIAEGDVPGILGRIGKTTSLDSYKDAGLVVEAVSEDLDVKRRIFADLDRIMPDGTILASNTSSISITTLAAATGRPDRVQ